MARTSAQQQAGDQEAREHEEDVDADESTRQEADAGVGKHDEEYGQRPEALNVGTVRGRGCHPEPSVVGGANRALIRVRFVERESG